MSLKTYDITLTSGSSVIIPALAGAQIHRLLRSGITLTQVTTFPAYPGPGLSYILPFTLIDSEPDWSMLFTYQIETGEFTFGLPGTGYSEPIRIVYSGGSIAVPPDPPPPPPVCEIPVPNVVVTEDDRIVVTMPSHADYELQVTASANACGVSPLQVASFNELVISDVFAVGTYKACIKRICSPGFESPFASVPFEITPDPPPPANFGARKYPTQSGIKIVGVTGFPLTVMSEAFPLDTAGEAMEGRHEAFTGAISVQVSVLPFIQVVAALYKNGALVQYIAVTRTYPTTVTLTFTAIPILSTDNIFVALDYT